MPTTLEDLAVACAGESQAKFSLFEKGGVLDPKLGRRYREIILEPGQSQEPEVLLRAFLGREPSSDAFLRGLGLR